MWRYVQLMVDVPRERWCYLLMGVAHTSRARITRFTLLTRWPLWTFINYFNNACFILSNNYCCLRLFDNHHGTHRCITTLPLRMVSGSASPFTRRTRYVPGSSS